MTFYEALEIAMAARGMKPSEVSDRAGLHRSYISKLKSGYMKTVEWDKALDIIDALGMTPNEFYAIYRGTGDNTNS